jgi:isopenicillin-N epimerase
VFENYQQWQRRIEFQPVEFLGRMLSSYLKESRMKLAQYLNTSCSNLVYIPNATHGINIIAHSLHLEPGDEVLTTDHEYGAMDRTWKYLSQKSGYCYSCVSLAIPISTNESLIDTLFSHVTSKTKVIFLSHITSPTALIFPIGEICKKARLLGIITVIDGAHAPGQIPVDLTKINPDFYVGNLHKWLCTPKGSAFLFASPGMQAVLEPLIVSWGWESDTPGESRFVDYFEWTGTQDFSSYLAVPAAIAFQNSNDWVSIQKSCHYLAKSFSEIFSSKFNVNSLFISDEWFAQMVGIILPDKPDPLIIKNTLYEKYRIEVPVYSWNNLTILRVSVQTYNSWSDLEHLYDALVTIFKS